MLREQVDCDREFVRDAPADEAGHSHLPNLEYRSHREGHAQPLENLQKGLVCTSMDPFLEKQCAKQVEIIRKQIKKPLL